VITQRILIDDETFSLRATVEAHGWHQLPPFDYADGVLKRVHRLKDGRVVHLRVEQTGNTSREDFLLLQTDGPVFMTDQFEIAGTVRLMLGMDYDLRPFYDLLRDRPAFAWVESKQAGRLLRAPTVWEDLVKTLLTTNTTWRQTITMCERLVTLGDESAFGHTFPTPAQVAALTVADLTAHLKCGYRGAYLHDLAARLAAGELEVETWISRDFDAPALYKHITALTGFGPYAAGSLLRLLGHHDYLSIDSVAREAFARWHGDDEKPADADLKAHYDQFGRWRGLVMWMDVLRKKD
jgi:3-methyladenine DNA glycosylase/8-oxoguanine DNA glycosylase